MKNTYLRDGTTFQLESTLSFPFVHDHLFSRKKTNIIIQIALSDHLFQPTGNESVFSGGFLVVFLIDPNKNQALSGHLDK